MVPKRIVDGDPATTRPEILDIIWPGSGMPERTKIVSTQPLILALVAGRALLEISTISPSMYAQAEREREGDYWHWR